MCTQPSALATSRMMVAHVNRWQQAVVDRHEDEARVHEGLRLEGHHALVARLPAAAVNPEHHRQVLRPGRRVDVEHLPFVCRAVADVAGLRLGQQIAKSAKNAQKCQKWQECQERLELRSILAILALLAFLAMSSWRHPDHPLQVCVVVGHHRRAGGHTAAADGDVIRRSAADVDQMPAALEGQRVADRTSPRAVEQNRRGLGRELSLPPLNPSISKSVTFRSTSALCHFGSAPSSVHRTDRSRSCTPLAYSNNSAWLARLSTAFSGSMVTLTFEKRMFSIGRSGMSDDGAGARGPWQSRWPR